MSKPVLVSVAFGQEYMACMRRLKESVAKFSPNSDALFYENTLPPGAKPHSQSPYGFKIQAIKEAARISPKVVWMDCTCFLVGDPNLYFEPPRYRHLEEKGVVVAFDSNSLYGLASPNLLSAYGISIDTCKNLYLVGGSLYVFDFNLEKCRKIFNVWAEMESKGLFSAASFPPHRWDEACMAIALHLNNSNALPYKDAGYRCNTIVNKDHWKEHI